MKTNLLLNLFFTLLLVSCGGKTPNVEPPKPSVLNITAVTINNQILLNNSTMFDISAVQKPVIKISFDKKIDVSKLNASLISFSGELGVNYSPSVSEDGKTLTFEFNVLPKPLTEYSISVTQADNLGGYVYPNFTAKFVTQIDPTPKFPTVPDDELLTLVQRQTFKYFWDYAHPVSGLARERFGSGETVTSGGSGFGLMAILVGIERDFITRQQGFERLNTIVNFLNRPETDKFHGVFPHWLNGTTGKVIPFSAKDNGADLIETSFLIQGLLTVQSYFKNGNAAEQAMCTVIQNLWEKVEWSWFQKNGENKLYWHWSPNYNWDMNMPITGWNEGLITYVLAASSPTYPISKVVYDEGWARKGAMKNGNQFYGITLPLGGSYGGPMFFAHYSFLGLDPQKLSDTYANYWVQNTAHAKINYNYCVANPKGQYGYGADCWGLTASDIPTGYTASSPTNDVGVIAPTAALASFPYTPEESMRALKYFYYILGDKLWGDYGFKDAFSLKDRWFANSYLAIDQGPIIIMIENYRTGLLWNYFMQNQNVKDGLTKLGFSYWCLVKSSEF